MSEEDFPAQLRISSPHRFESSLSQQENIFLCLASQPLPVHGGVPASGQREVDDHVHWNEVGHGVIVGPHGAQDPFSRLETAATE